MTIKVKKAPDSSEYEDLTPKKLEEILAYFGIEPRSDGFYHAADFERAWRVTSKNPGMSAIEIKKKLEH